LNFARMMAPPRAGLHRVSRVTTISAPLRPEPLARAVALLGDDAELRRAARVAGLSMERAEAALDGLVASELIAPVRPPDLSHPVVQAAMSAGRRSRAHRTAAHVLREEGTAAEPLVGAGEAEAPLGTAEHAQQPDAHVVVGRLGERPP
jgi:hypothetical protein